MATRKKTETEKTDPSETLSKTNVLSDEMIEIKQQSNHEPLSDKYVHDILSSTKTRWNHFISKRKIIIIIALALISWIIVLGLVTFLLTEF